MNKLLSSVLLIGSLIILSFSTSFAQQHGPTKLGFGIVYGEGVESAGINANATFRISPEFELSPNINVYFPDNDESPFDAFTAINFNGHYIFAADQGYHIYGLGGLNLALFDGGGSTQSELGVNLGIGGEYHLEEFSLFSELKYVVGDLDQVVLGVGARFPI